MKKTLRIDSAATVVTALTVALAGVLSLGVVGCGDDEVAAELPECKEVVVLHPDAARDLFAERAVRHEGDRAISQEATVDPAPAVRDRVAQGSSEGEEAAAAGPVGSGSRRGDAAAVKAEVIDERRQEEATRDLREQEDALHSELEIVDDAVATGVVKREPVGVSAHFGDDEGMLWAWVQVRNLKAPSQVTMVWRHEGKVRSRVTLDVGVSPRWRTWSRKSVGAKDHGEWTVEVLSPAGETLRTLTFEVSPAKGSAQVAGKSSPV